MVDEKRIAQAKIMFRAKTIFWLQNLMGRTSDCNMGSRFRETVICSCCRRRFVRIQYIRDFENRYNEFDTQL